MNYYPFTVHVHVYVNLCIVCIEPSIIQFEKEVEYDNDDEGDDEVWHSETYKVESGEGKTPVILITTAGVMNLGIVKFVQRVQ